jgi:hypothetical protein
MARIRSIKPEFFIDEDLQDLEAANPGAYCMLVFSGLWTVADREGRFEWRPRRLKLEILPFLDYDLGVTLDLLDEHGYLIRYEVEGRTYGFIKNWSRHQLVPRDEPQSEIPSPEGLITPYFRPVTQTQRFNIYQSDSHTCQYCGTGLHNNPRAMCLDHVIPYSKGGTNRPENLVTACKKCNAKKATKTPEEAGMPWPKGKGEHMVDGVPTPINTPLTGSQRMPDKEGEGEWEWEEEREEDNVSVGKGGSRDSRATSPPLDDPEIEEEVKRIERLHLQTCGLSTLPPLGMVREILRSGKPPSLIDDVYQAHGGDIAKYRQRNIVERLTALRDGQEREPPRGRRPRDGLSASERRQEATFAAAREFAGGDG